MYRKLDDLVNEALQPDDSLDFNSKVDEAAVRRLAHKKLGLPTPVSAAPRRKTKALRRVVAFAAVAGALTVGAFAAVQLFQLGQAPVEHFGGAASTAGAQNQYESLKPTMEQMTTTANLSQTVEGVTITLQTVTADSNSLNLAFTMDNPNLDLNMIEGKYPDWHKAEMASPKFTIKQDGKAVEINSCNGVDSYVDETGTLHAFYHLVLPEVLPEHFTLEVEILEQKNWPNVCLPTDARFAYALEIDRTAVAGTDKVAAGQTIDLGQEYPLQLKELRQSGLGMLMRIEFERLQNETSVQDTIPLYCIRDEKGNILPTLTVDERYLSGDSKNSRLQLITELQSPAADANQLTIVPISHAGEYEGENRRYSVADLGAKIETTEVGGYIFTDYQVNGSQIKLTFTPYGYNGGLLEAVMEEPNEVHYKGAMSPRKNYQNGTVEIFIDYYEATEEELSALTGFTVYYQSGWSLDEAHAVTLPFGPAQ